MVVGERASLLVPGKEASGGSTGMQEKLLKTTAVNKISHCIFFPQLPEFL